MTGTAALSDFVPAVEMISLQHNSRAANRCAGAYVMRSNFGQYREGSGRFVSLRSGAFRCLSLLISTVAALIVCMVFRSPDEKSVRYANDA